MVHLKARRCAVIVAILGESPHDGSALIALQAGCAKGTNVAGDEHLWKAWEDKHATYEASFEAEQSKKRSSAGVGARRRLIVAGGRRIRSEYGRSGGRTVARPGTDSGA